MISSSDVDVTRSEGLSHDDRTTLQSNSITDPTQTEVPVQSIASRTASEQHRGIGSGRRIGDFEIRQQIGRGGMAYVYEAWQDSLQRSVALKVLPFWSSTDSRQITRLKNEARALASLEHPNIVPVYAVGEDSGVHYLAMRLIDGQPLDRVITELGESSDAETLSSGIRENSAGHSLSSEFSRIQLRADQPAEDRYRAVASLGATIARALHAAHEYGVVHRDIKPSNILLGRDGRPWVADFGLAHCDAATHLTRPGAFVGTPRYASPEQASGESALVDHRTDIFSLGLTLFELATLTPAFDRSPGTPDARRYDREPPRLTRQRPDIPPDLENIILKAASPVRDDRYATARDLAADLDRFLAGEVPHARRPGLIEHVTRWSRRNARKVVAFTSAVMVLLAASVTIGGLIFREKLKTESALVAAQRNFRQARTVVDEFGAELTEQLAMVPGTEHIRRELLLDTIRYYRSFIDQAGDSVELHGDLATALNKIAVLTEHVGTTEEAIGAHLEALAAFERLCREQPDSDECRADLALCQNNLALLVSRTQDRAQAELRFRQAIALQESLVKTQPGVARYQRELGLSQNNLAMLLSGCPGSWTESAELYRSAIAHFESAAEIDPGHAEVQRYLATSYSNLASLHDGTDSGQSLTAQQQSVQVLEDVVAALPHCVESTRELALSLNNLGALHSRRGDHSASAAAYRKASRLQYDLLQRAPQSQAYRRDLAVGENNIGLALARAGSNREAEKSFRRAIQFQEELVLERPDDLNDAASLAGIWNNIGMVLETQSQLAASCEAYEQAIDLLADVLRQTSGDTGVRENLSRTYFNLTRALLTRGHVDRAVEFVLRRRNLWPSEPDRLLSVARQLAAAAHRIQELDASTPSRLSYDACGRLVSETLERAIESGLDPSSIRNLHELRQAAWRQPAGQ